MRTRPVASRGAGRKPRTFGERALVVGNLAVMAVLLGVPLALLVERSLSTGSGYGFGYYVSLFDESARSALAVPPIEAIGNSLLYGVIATLIAGTLGLMASQVIASGRGRLPRAFDALLTLPLGTSAVILGFGFLISLGSLPIDLRISPWLVPIAHSLIALPFVVRAVTPVLRSLDHRLHEAAAVLGASPSRTWRALDLPLIAGALLIGAGFAFAVSLGEFGATLFIVRPDNPTMPIAIYRLLGQPGSLAFGQAMAMASLVDGGRGGIRARDRPRPNRRAGPRLMLSIEERHGPLRRGGCRGRRHALGERWRAAQRPGAERLGQVHAAARHCRTRATRRWPRRMGRKGSRRHADPPPRIRPDVPGLRAVPASRRGCERALRTGRCERRSQGRGRARRRVARAGRADRFRAPRARRAVGRRAATSRTGPSARSKAATLDARRAARRPRSRAADARSSTSWTSCSPELACRSST